MLQISMAPRAGRVGRYRQPQLLGNPFGLGAYEAGACADGADIVCSERNGEYSCRPCDYDQLYKIQALQEQINRVLAVYGGNPINVDGRIGDDTTRAAGLAYQAAKANGYEAPASIRSALAAAASSPTSTSTIDAFSKVADDSVPFYQTVADAEGAPAEVPEGPPEPPSPGPSDGGPWPPLPPAETQQPEIGPETPVTDYQPPAAKPKRSKAPFVIGGLAILTTVGLVATAAYSRRRKS